MSILPKIILWWYFSKIEVSTPCLQVTFVLVQNIRSIHDIELFTKWIGLSIICEYPDDDVRESSYWPTEFVISFFHQFELRALKSPVIIEQIGISSFILLRSKSKFTQKFSNSSLFWLGERYIQVKIHFSLCERISVTKQLSKVQTSSHLIRGICSL